MMPSRKIRLSRQKEKSGLYARVNRNAAEFFLLISIPTIPMGIIISTAALEASYIKFWK